MINRNDDQNPDINRQMQMGLFDPPMKSIDDPGPALKAAMRDADKAAQRLYFMSRDNIIDAMNAMADSVGITCNGNARKVTLHIYNKWLSSSELHYIPLRWLHIFCFAVRSNKPLEVYTSFFNQVRLVAEDDLKKLQWAELEIKKRKLSRQAKQLATEVGL